MRQPIIAAHPSVVPWRLGYNTNGLAHHDPFQAVELLAELGYRSVALTLDHGALDPFATDADVQFRRMRELLDRLEMRSVIETGARYLLDAHTKHEPTLVSADPAGRERRVEFLRRAIDAARALGSDCVSLWSGVVRDAAPENIVWNRLVAGLGEVLAYASRSPAVTIGFEPEPGMFIDTMGRFAELSRRLNHEQFQLTLDVGHLQCQGEVPIDAQIHRWSERLVNVHIEDMRSGVHEHLMFGDGEMDFPPILVALTDCGYTGGVHVELSRHSHEGPSAASKAFEFLNRIR